MTLKKGRLIINYLHCRSYKDQCIAPEGADYGFHRNHLISLIHPGISTTPALLEDTGIDTVNRRIILMSSNSHNYDKHANSLGAQSTKLTQLRNI